MVVVAIAGSTGGDGRTVLDAISKAGEHKAIVLSRTAADATATNGPRRLAVDYNSRPDEAYLAAYIEGLVGLPPKEWPRESLIASNKLQVKDLEPLIKKITGKDFKVTYNSVEAIHKGNITPLPSNEAVLKEPAKGEMFREVELQVMLSMLSYAHDLPGKNLAELFPDVKPTNIEDYASSAVIKHSFYKSFRAMPAKEIVSYYA